MVEHKHLIIRAEVNKPFVDPEITKDWLRRLVAAIGMNITKSGGPHVDYVDVPGNSGIAGVVMIETSHCSIHIWEQADPPLVQMDVYSCKCFDVDVVLEHLNEMEPTKVDHLLLDRRSNIRQEIDKFSSVEELDRRMG
jgi:S-adenosylmethionine/arginine decarboxylase-like enzyme